MDNTGKTPGGDEGFRIPGLRQGERPRVSHMYGQRYAGHISVSDVSGIPAVDHALEAQQQSGSGPARRQDYVVAVKLVGVRHDADHDGVDASGCRGAYVWREAGGIYPRIYFDIAGGGSGDEQDAKREEVLAALRSGDLMFPTNQSALGFEMPVTIVADRAQGMTTITVSPEGDMVIGDAGTAF